ncbi:MAG: hypothetical protein COV36_03420 [Alphaproteobacteria bacterium CG11_big_fil_rev_8_21_14_0_20_44_7]|nr:MAG: hypothetical protein COV36_03420 [Alphaproteobacteria bacterium CG11_big_fil_rev_8_21_14_0_20_44_7]
MRYLLGGIFLLIIGFLPDAAYAAITDFTVNPGSCGNPEAFNIECSSSPDAGLFTSIACKVMKTFNAGIIPLYCNIVGNPIYQNMLNGFLTLYVLFWVFSYLFGLSQTNTGNAMIRLLKVMIIYAFVSDPELFFGLLYQTIMNVPQHMVEIILSDTGSETFYEYVDKGMFEVFNNVLRPEVVDESGATKQSIDLRLFEFGIAVWKLLPGGSFVATMFISVVSGWLAAYLSIMIRYLLALMTIVFLLMLTPLFLPTLLFEKTAFVGEEWIRMLSSFMLQIVIVVAYVIMVEVFFVEFLDLIKFGFNEIVIDRSYNEYIVPYGKNADGEFVSKIENAMGGVNLQGAEKYITDISYGGDPKEFIPWFIFQMLVMLIIVFLTFSFMKRVPAFAGYLAGNPKFVRLMGGQGFAQRGSENEAPLYMQNKVKGKLSSYQARLDKVIDDDLSSFGPE